MSIENKYLQTVRSIYRGITSPKDDHLKEIVGMRTPREECTRFNPPPERLLPEIVKVLESRKDISLSNLKSDLGIKRSDVMTLFASFIDHHKIERVKVFSPYTEGAVAVINGVMEKQLPVTIPEQFGMALGRSEGNISLAVIYLSLATRMMARNSDSRIFPISFSDNAIFLWKNKVAPFGWVENDSDEDPAGDTYHLWLAALAGISREEKSDPGPINKAKQFVCDNTYPHVAGVTQILRHEFFFGIQGLVGHKTDDSELQDKIEWPTHGVVDRVGYNLGRYTVNFYESHNHIDNPL